MNSPLVCERCLRPVPRQRCALHPWAAALAPERPADQEWLQVLRERRRERVHGRLGQAFLGLATGAAPAVGWAVAAPTGLGDATLALHATILVGGAALGGLLGALGALRGLMGSVRRALRGIERLDASTRALERQFRIARRWQTVAWLSPAALYPVGVALSLGGVPFLLDDQALYRATTGHFLEDHLGFAMVQGFFITLTLVAASRALAARRTRADVMDPEHALLQALPPLDVEDPFDEAEGVSWFRAGIPWTPAAVGAQRVIR